MAQKKIAAAFFAAAIIWMQIFRCSVGNGFYQNKMHQRCLKYLQRNMKGLQARASFTLIGEERGDEGVGKGDGDREVFVDLVDHKI